MEEKSDQGLRPIPWRMVRATALLIALIAVLYVGRDWFGPAVESRPASRRTQCLNNIRNLVCFADGHALPIKENIDPAVLKQLLQIDDGVPDNFP
jgi:hypothetical protein